MIWSAQEEQFLRDHYFEKGRPFCAKSLNRTEGSIRGKASKMGLKRSHYKLKKTDEEYKEELKYTEYMAIEMYQGSSELILHKHLVCGHEWKARPNQILRSGSCPNCTNKGTRYLEPCFLYFIEFKYLLETYYKVGITKFEDISPRYAGDWNTYKMKVMWKIPFDTGAQAKEVERKFLKKYSHLLVNTGILKNGNTETFGEFIPWPSFATQ